MCSVAILNMDDTIPIAQWSPKERRVAKRMAISSLEYVGVSSTDAWEDGPICSINVRRQCTDDERRRVNERFLSA